MIKQVKQARKSQIQNILKQPTLAKLKYQAQKIDQLNKQLDEIIEIPAWQYCFVSKVTESTAHILCSNQSHLFWLKNQHEQTIRNTIGQITHQPNIKYIIWTMKPTQYEMPQPKANIQNNPMNQHTKKLIHDCAQKTHYGPLKAALLKLSNTHTQDTN